MKIQRNRWVIMRNKRTEIFCGSARSFIFKPIDDIGNTAIKTYRSKNIALNSFFECSWWSIDFDYEAVEIIETYESVEEN